MALLLHVVELGHQCLRLGGLAVEDRVLELDRELRAVEHHAAVGRLEGRLVLAELRLRRGRHAQRRRAALGADHAHLQALRGLEVGGARRRVHRRGLERLVRAVDLLHRALDVDRAAGLAAALSALATTLAAAHAAGLREGLELRLVDEAVLVGVGAVEDALGERAGELVLRELAVTVGVLLHDALDHLGGVAAAAAGALAVLAAGTTARGEGAVLLGGGDRGERESEGAGENACVGHVPRPRVGRLRVCPRVADEAPARARENVPEVLRLRRNTTNARRTTKEAHERGPPSRPGGP